MFTGVAMFQVTAHDNQLYAILNRSRFYGENIKLSHSAKVTEFKRVSS